MRHMLVLDRKRAYQLALDIGTEMLADPDFAESVRQGSAKWWKPCEILTRIERKELLFGLQGIEARLTKKLSGDYA